MDALQDKLVGLTINSSELFLLELDITLEEKFPVIYTDSKNLLALGISHGALVIITIQNDIKKRALAYIKVFKSCSSNRSAHLKGIVNKALIRNMFGANHSNIRIFTAVVHLPDSVDFSPKRNFANIDCGIPKLFDPLWFLSPEIQTCINHLPNSNLHILTRTSNCFSEYRKAVFCSCEFPPMIGYRDASSELISQLLSGINEAKMLNHAEDKLVKRICNKLHCFGLWKSKVLGTNNLPSDLRKTSTLFNNTRASMESLSDVGGYTDVKILLLEAINSILKPASTKFGIEPIKGILLYGPPGCSKTLIAKTISAKTGMNFYSIKGPEIFSKWVGDSEKRLKEIFMEARKNEPSVVFIDEIDSIAKKRGTSGSSVDMRVLSQLLTEFDGMHSHSGNFIVIGATNRPDILDDALLRPGRLDKHIYVPLPSKESVQEIIRILHGRFCISPEIDAVDIVLRFQGYSGAEIVSIFQDAAYLSLSENHNEISLNILLKAISNRRPGTQPDLLRYYEEFQAQHSVNVDY